MPSDGTVLMLAAYEGHGEVARALLEAKADVEARDADGSTALMLAVDGGHVWKSRKSAGY